MKVNRYEGYDLDDLVRQIKDDMGGHLKVVKREVKTERGWLPFFKRKKHVLYVEVPIFDESEFEEALEKEEKHVEMDGLLEKIGQMMDEKIKAIENRPVPVAADIPPHASEYVPIQKELFDAFTGDALDLLKLLMQKDVEADVAKQLVEEACGLDIDSGKLDLSTQMFRDALKIGIEKHIGFSNPLEVEKGKFKVITFVGPTGVGKTTNLFKIASEFVINRELKVAVISTDTFKVGAVQQARAYASILNVPFYAISDSKNLTKTLEKMNDIDVVLIDTVGRSQYDYWRLGEIKEAIGGGKNAMEIILVISCNYKNREAIEIANRFRTFFPINSLFFTKIDETYHPGTLVNLPVKTGIPVSLISTGQRVPEDFKLLDAEKLTDYLLGE